MQLADRFWRVGQQLCCQLKHSVLRQGSLHGTSHNNCTAQAGSFPTAHALDQYPQCCLPPPAALCATQATQAHLESSKLKPEADVQRPLPCGDVELLCAAEQHLLVRLAFALHTLRLLSCQLRCGRGHHTLLLPRCAARPQCVLRGVLRDQGQEVEAGQLHAAALSGLLLLRCIARR